MSGPPELDWRALPLPAQVLIEASAGTGKTYNLSLLYLRIVLELGVGARQILVTTFTDAAAQELKARIRARLAEAELMLMAQEERPDKVRTHDRTQETLPASDPALLDWLGALAERTAPGVLRHRLQLAQAELDLAPISTIHGFCRRVLSDFPFESSAAFALGSIVAADGLIGECVEDFWRARYLGAPISAWERATVVPKGAHALKRAVSSLLQVKDAQARGGAVFELTELWRDWRDAEPVALTDLFREQNPWFARVNGMLRTRLLRFRDALRADTPETVDWKELAELLSPDELFKAQKTAARPLAGHPAIMALVAVLPGMHRPAEQMLMAVAHGALPFVEAEVQRRLAARGQLTYDALIDDVYRRLADLPGEDGVSRALLAERLFEAFPVALIDEFQDTDARQWAIFERIYRRRGTLLLIGDPKQAIYSFRGGDLHAYLHAREQLSEQRSLRHNHRSSSALIAAWNALYAHAGSAGFADSGIDYVAVTAAPAKGDEQRGYRIGDVPLGQPLVFHLRSDQRFNNKELPALRACANDIASLLNDCTHEIDGRPLEPGDIAVLVDSNFQINLLRKLLQERGVPVVGSGRANVLASSWAQDLKLLMYALLHGNDARAIRAALATRLMGIRAVELRALDHNASAWERVLQQFAEHTERLRRHGMQAVIEALVAEHAPRLLRHADGERALTDLRHLGELLQTAAQDCFGPEQLYEWLQQATNESGGGADEAAEEAQLRIESEARRVQLMTVHASKGLEFPIVFLPLGWRTRHVARYPPPFARFHEGHAQHLDLGSADFPANLRAHFHEDLGERMRKLYVGLTRAKYALHVYGDRQPRRFRASSDAELGELDAWIGAALDAVAVDGDGADPWAALVRAVPSIEVRDGYSEGLVAYHACAPTPPVERAARTPLPLARPYRGIHSFTSLSRPARAAVGIDALPGAEDEAVPAALPPGEPEADGETPAQTPHPQLLALSRLRGAEFGNALHEIFEKREHALAIGDQRNLIEEALMRRAVSISPARGEDTEDLGLDLAVTRIADLVTRVLTADLGNGLRLATLPSTALRAEFDFCFELEHARLPALQILLAEYGGGAWLSPREGVHSLLGLMKGYIDLVFHWQGRFHLLDYKSNWLGEHLESYRGPGLEAAMASHHYPLQALIYTVALQRYLRTRIADYDYERHLGESWYVFVRAVGLGTDAGVWRRRFPQPLVDGMDRLFAGGGQP